MKLDYNDRGVIIMLIAFTLFWVGFSFVTRNGHKDDVYKDRVPLGIVKHVYPMQYQFGTDFLLIETDSLAIVARVPEFLKLTIRFMAIQ